MGLEDRDWVHEERAKKEGKTWKRPGRFMPPPKPDSEQPWTPHPQSELRAGTVQGDPRTPKQRSVPSYVHLQAQEILESRNRKSPPPFSLAVLVFVCLSVGVAALYLYF